MDYYGQTKSDDESAGKEVVASRAVIVGAAAKPEMDYYGQTKSDGEFTGKEVADSRAVIGWC